MTLTALLSSFGSLVISGITNSANIFFIDMTLNVLCIILMTSYYKGWYKRLCCCCIRSCILCCLCDKEQQKMYKDHIEQSNVKTKSSAVGDTATDKHSKTSTNGESEEMTTPVPDSYKMEKHTTEMSSTMRKEIQLRVERTSEAISVNIEMDKLRKENEKLRDMVKQMENRINDYEGNGKGMNQGVGDGNDDNNNKTRDQSEEP